MPRIRTIKPEITTDRKLATVSLEARLTFIYTWTIADDDGLFRAEERQLLGSLFAHDSRVSRETLETWLEELVSIELLRWRTTKDGSRVGEIVNWRKHQKIDRPSASFISKQLQPLTSRSQTRSRDTLAKPSREARETLAPVVQSPESIPTTPAPDGAGSPDNKAAGQRDGKPNPAREWARPYYEPWVKRFGGRPNVGFLRKQVEPLEQADGRELTIKRWQHLVAGLNPRFFGKGDPFRAAVLRFTGAPAAYDDADWHLSDRDRAEVAQLRESLGLP